jgi:hypothetical protein
MYVPFHDKSSIWRKEMTRQLSSQGPPGIIKETKSKQTRKLQERRRYADALKLKHIP